MGGRSIEGEEEWRVDRGGRRTTNVHNNENNEGLTYSSAGVLGLFDCSPDEESARLRHDPDPRHSQKQSSHISQVTWGRSSAARFGDPNNAVNKSWDGGRRPRTNNSRALVDNSSILPPQFHQSPCPESLAAMAQEMETFAARLASFDRVLYPEKRRSSSAKSAKPIAWPHSRPSPAEVWCWHLHLEEMHTC